MVTPMLSTELSSEEDFLLTRANGPDELVIEPATGPSLFVVGLVWSARTVLSGLVVI